MRIDMDKCNACLRCYDQCKRHGTTLVNTQGKTFIVINTNCDGCGECIDICQNGAIYRV